MPLGDLQWLQLTSHNQCCSLRSSQKVGLLFILFFFFLSLSLETYTPKKIHNNRFILKANFMNYHHHHHHHHMKSCHIYLAIAIRSSPGYWILHFRIARPIQKKFLWFSPLTLNNFSLVFSLRNLGGSSYQFT